MSTNSTECNCPDYNDMLMRGEVMGTKPPCPVHDTPERLALLKSIVVLPRVTE
jgi:hypothetical protein